MADGSLIISTFGKPNVGRWILKHFVIELLSFLRLFMKQKSVFPKVNGVE
jgi:hypothetical protein